MVKKGKVLYQNETIKTCGDSSNYLQAIIDSLEDELMVIGKDYRIIEANLAVLARHQKRRYEVIGKYCYDISHGLPELCRPPHHECPIKVVYETNKPARVTHIHVYDDNGESRERYVDIIASPITDSQGNIVAVAELLRDVTEAKELELENAKLHQQVQHQDEIRGELLREIFSIQEEERRRIARELHDETTQTLASLAASLEAIASLLPDSANEVKKRLKKQQSLSIKILDEIHRLIYQLRPTLLDDLGLVAALRWLAESNLEAIGIAVNFKTTGQDRRPSSQLETTLFRVMQEAISNIARHSNAKKVSIDLNFKKNAIRVDIKDDGVGFDVEEAITSKERP
ncbi:histidine kinase [Chloroflexota bacterium]